MDRNVTRRSASSPGASDSSPAAVMNDSFLEDMQLFSHDNNFHVSDNEMERYVTRRTLSPSVAPFAAVIEERDGFEQADSKNSTHLPKVPSASVTTRKSTLRDVGGNSEKVTAAKESKAKVQDSRTRSKPGETQSKPLNEASKSQQKRKSLVEDRSRRSGSQRESDQSSEASKENKQPSNSFSKRVNSPLETSKRRTSGGKKPDFRDIPESVALLSAIEEIVSTYIKAEGTKTFRALNELHILSQASMIKNLMFQTDEIRKDLQLGENLGQLKVLMADNDRLKENCALLKMKNEDLQRRLEETERVKEENASLKLRLQEITGRKSS